jgi:hypothetical protein
MEHAEATECVGAGNKKIENGLNRIDRKIKKKEAFGAVDLKFVEFLLRKKLSCQQCRGVLSRLYLNLKYGKKVALNSTEWELMRTLGNHKRVLEIPEVQIIPIDDSD